MLINLSNHPSSKWGDEQQLQAATKYGEVVDIPFPNIPPDWSHEQVHDCAWHYANTVVYEQVPAGGKFAVHLMGETSFVVAFARYWRDLTDDEVDLLCSTTERIVEEMPDGSKQSTFRFVQFRQM